MQDRHAKQDNLFGLDEPIVPRKSPAANERAGLVREGDEQGGLRRRSLEQGYVTGVWQTDA
jgi:hypothetical protein